MIEGIVFDLDGVICSTDEYHYLAWKKIADQEGIYFDRNINNRLRGVSRMASLDIILERAKKNYSPAEKLALATAKNETYRSLLANLRPEDVAPSVIVTLKWLKAERIFAAIGSSSKNTKTILDRIGLLKAFDVIVDGNDISNSKPDPEVFLKAAARLGLKPSACIVVEDAYAGIEAAKRGGFTAVGIGDASKDKEADYHIEDLSGLIAVVRSLNHLS